MRIIPITRYALAVLLTFTTLSATAATVRYSYTGADTSTFTGNSTSVPGSGLPSPWIPSAPMTGWIELETDLAANLNNVDISTLVDSWAFGPSNLLLNSEAAAYTESYFGGNCGPDVTRSCFSMAVTTNAQGDITEWNLDVMVQEPDGGYASRITRFLISPISENGESIYERTYQSLGGGFFVVNTASSASVGSWSGPTVVPIPGAVWLFVSALGLIGWRSRRYYEEAALFAAK